MRSYDVVFCIRTTGSGSNFFLTVIHHTCRSISETNNTFLRLNNKDREDYNNEDGITNTRTRKSVLLQLNLCIGRDEKAKDLHRFLSHKKCWSSEK